MSIRPDENPAPGTFRDASAGFPARAADLLGRLTRAEKIAMVHQYAPAVPRLGLAEFRTGSEALHGVAWLGEATVFPQAVGLAATWDPELLREVGIAVGEELREFQRKDPLVSLLAWAPVVNLLRDPRWGRNEEGYSEDPLLTTELATAYCAGLRGEHPRYWRVAPLLKHFLAYNNEDDRVVTSSTVRPRVLHEYDIVPFREVVKAGVAIGVMPGYNLVNGRPNHVSPLLGTLRQYAPHELVVCSDAQAPSNLVDAEHYFDDHASSHAAALRAGVDSFTDNDADAIPTKERLTEALARGLITEADIDRAVYRMLLVRLMLGEFDTDHPYASAPAEPVVNCPAHQQLAHRAARDAVVLLKNTGVLPLEPVAGSRIAVLGPFADELAEDWYSGTMPYRSTVAGGLRNALALDEVTVVAGSAVDRIVLDVDGGGAIGLGVSGPALRVGGPAEEFAVFDWGAGVLTLRSVSLRRCVTVTEDGALVVGPRRPGGWEVRETFTLERPDGDTVLLRHVATGDWVSADAEGLRLADEDQATPLRVTVVRSAREQVRELVAECDTAIVVVGNDPHINGRETQDRPFLGLPDTQEALVRLTGQLVPDTVLVLMSSYPIAATWADEHLPAILWTSHGGQETGNALAEVLLGEHSPSGRLPQTWYHGESDLPDILDYDIIGSHATYQYFPGTPCYPFGHGLSYTSFAHDRPRLVEPVIDPGDPVVLELVVRNTGPCTGTDVIQCYVHAIRPRQQRPIRQLAGFARARLDPGVSELVRIKLDPIALTFWDVTTDSAVIDPGEYDIQVGRSCTDLTGIARLTVRGERQASRPITGQAVRAADFDAQSGTTIVDVDRVAGDAVARQSEDGAGWLVFRAAELPASAAVAVGVSRTEPGPARLEFRGDAWDGPLLAAVTVPSTGDRYAWSTVSAQLRGEPGVTDLYLVLRGALRISEFRVTPEQRSDRSA